MLFPLVLVGVLVGIAAVLEVFGHVLGFDAVGFREVQGTLNGADVAFLALVGLVPPFVALVFEFADLFPELAVLGAEVAQGFLQIAGEDFVALDALMGELGLQGGHLGLVAVLLAVEGQAGAPEGVCGGL